MPIPNEKIYEAIMGLREDIGGLKAMAANNHEFTKAVSAKGDRIEKKIDDHAKDDGAHGQKTSRRLIASIATWGGVILAAVEIALTGRTHH